MVELRSNFCHVMSFYSFQVSFEEIYYTFAKKLDKIFRTTLKEKTFAIVGKRLEHWRVERLCVFIVKRFYMLQAFREQKFKEWIQCLRKNVVDRLFVATNQSTNDPRVHTMRLNTIHLSLIRDPIVY